MVSEPTDCKYGCGHKIIFERQPDGKWLVSEWDETTMRKGERHSCPNFQTKPGKLPQSTLPAGKIWTGTDRQGQFTQYKVNEIPNAEKIFQILTDIYKGQECLPRIEKLVHDQNILLHTIIEERKGTENPPPKKSEEFGEQGENAASNLEEYDY